MNEIITTTSSPETVSFMIVGVMWAMAWVLK